MSETATSRRNFLAAAPALAVLTAGPAVALALPSGAPAIDPGLLRAIEALREANRQSKIYDNTVLLPALERYDTLCAAIPHRETVATLSGKRLSTSDKETVRVARQVIEVDRLMEGDYADAATAELVKLANERDAQIDAISEELGLEAMDQRSDEMGRECADALRAIQNYPVRTIADLIAKLEIDEAEGFDETPLDVLLTDLRRIGGAA